MLPEAGGSLAEFICFIIMPKAGMGEIHRLPAFMINLINLFPTLTAGYTTPEPSELCLSQTPPEK
jgi:hypothetical protein